MIRKSILGLALLSVVAFSGCGEEQTSNMVEGADEDEFAAYERMIAEDEQMMDEEDDSGVSE